MDGKLRLLWWGLTIVPLIVIGATCSEPYDCPDHQVKLPPIHSGDTAWSSVPLAGPISGIAEFHDCQRLVSLNDKTKYGALVGIWVSQVLDKLPDSLGMFEAIRPELPRGGGMVKPDTIALQPIVVSALPVGTALAFAEIYAWPEPSGKPPGYRPLGIMEGWNCLYLFRESSGLAARMEPVGDPKACTEPRQATSLAGKHLNVKLVSAGLPAGNGNYPAVGRWEWDGTSHYIGMGCHIAWCEVTDKDLTSFASSKDYFLPAGASDEERRVYEVKGWYDEQRLALYKGGGLHVASFKGTIVPDPKLDGIDDPNEFAGHWLPVAKVALEEESLDYANKLNLHHGNLPEGTRLEDSTQVYLCAKTQSSCFPSDTPPSCSFKDSDGEWWAKIVAPNGHVEYRCARRVDHSGLVDVNGNRIHIPGAARWKWSETDEQMWVRCAQGCCPVQ
jgi:hypothetical protein